MALPLGLLAGCNSQDYFVRIEFRLIDDVSGESQHIRRGHKAIKPLNPTWHGYDFIGWHTGGYNAEFFNFTRPIMRDTIFFAMWKQTQNNGNAFVPRVYTQPLTNGGFIQTFKGRLPPPLPYNIAIYNNQMALDFSGIPGLLSIEPRNGYYRAYNNHMIAYIIQVDNFLEVQLMRGGTARELFFELDTSISLATDTPIALSNARDFRHFDTELTWTAMHQSDREWGFNIRAVLSARIEIQRAGSSFFEPLNIYREAGVGGKGVSFRHMLLLAGGWFDHMPNIIRITQLGGTFYLAK